MGYSGRWLSSARSILKRRFVIGVGDNPVNGTDPSGLCVLGLFGSHCNVGKTLTDIGVGLGVAAGIATGVGAPAALAIGLGVGATAAGAAGGAIAGGAGGGISGAALGAVGGGATAAFGAAGDGVPALLGGVFGVGSSLAGLLIPS